MFFSEKIKKILLFLKKSLETFTDLVYNNCCKNYLGGLSNVS